jgi:hypothetical protein
LDFKKIVLIIGVVLLVGYIMFGGSSDPVVDPKDD